MNLARSLFTAACLAALGGPRPTTAHHAVTESQYLAFWSGFQLPQALPVAMETCLEARFWEKGFISIYPQVWK